MKNGMINAILAYTIWGIIPLYWKWFETMPAGEILTHRIVWSFVFVGGLIAIQKRWREIAAILKSWKMLFPLIISSVLITINWLVFIWAVNNGHVVETSLGYYLNPLISVLLAVMFLREKPNRGQWLAIALAGAGVLFVAVDYGSFPWISLSLAFSFGLYGLAKKRVVLDASVGLFLETLIVVPIAILYMGYLGTNDQSTAWGMSAGSFLLLMLSGAVTALPLLLFAKAAKRLTLSTLGFVQYIGPSLTLLLSVLVFKEEISAVLLVSFSLIWAASIVYTAASIRSARAVRKAHAES